MKSILFCHKLRRRLRPNKVNFQAPNKWSQSDKPMLLYKETNDFAWPPQVAQGASEQALGSLGGGSGEPFGSPKTFPSSSAFRPFSSITSAVPLVRPAAGFGPPWPSSNGQIYSFTTVRLTIPRCLPKPPAAVVATSLDPKLEFSPPSAGGDFLHFELQQGTRGRHDSARF